jgi:hypothetical protein
MFSQKMRRKTMMRMGKVTARNGQEIALTGNLFPVKNWTTKKIKRTATRTIVPYGRAKARTSSPKVDVDVQSEQGQEAGEE